MNFLKIENELDNTIDIQVEIDDINIPIEVDENNVDLIINEDEQINITMDSAVHEVSSTKHNELQNRNLPDQHSIESITNLQNELDAIRNLVVRSYNDLLDKPKINDVELIGNKTHNDIKITALDDVDIGAILD